MSPEQGGTGTSGTTRMEKKRSYWQVDTVLADARTAGIDDVLDQVGLADVADDRARGFSLGMRQRLGLAAALPTKPRLLVLDEPSNGLDPAGKRHVHGVLTRLAADGTSVVVSSHRMDDLEALL